jgi:gamma-glutamylcyclotransferase (GGCT)/AIG2-like uncharacterized protein YtfP
MTKGDIDTGPLLFVYGTLMSSADNAFAATLAKYASKLCNGTFRGIMYRVHHPSGEWNYPAVVDSDEASDLVHGEIYQLTSGSLFDLLDDYEACGPNSPKPHEYRRQIAEVRKDDDQATQAYIYLYARSTDGLEVISDGIFDSAKLR